MVLIFLFFFFFKQKTAYEMLISDWSSDVCSSDLLAVGISLIAHFLGWACVELARNLFIAIPDILPAKGMMWAPIETLLRPDGSFQPVFTNPIAAMVQYADGGHLQVHELAMFGGLVLLESFLVANLDRKSKRLNS